MSLFSKCLGNLGHAVDAVASGLTRAGVPTDQLDDGVVSFFAGTGKPKLEEAAYQYGLDFLKTKESVVSTPVPTPPPTLLPMPADGVVFEMTLDGEDPTNHPINGMVKGHGFTGTWKYFGKKVEGTQTGKFIWVSVGYQPNLDSVRTACLQVAKDLGYEGTTIPGGQWREEVLRYQYNGVLWGIADPSWENPRDEVSFPYMGGNGIAGFGYAGGYFSGRGFCRWLVRVS